MADGCLLLVDAFEGPMPQTRFVLQKALQLGLKPVVVVNKVDKPNCRPEEVYEMVFDLMCDLNATEEQLDFPVVYGSAKNDWMSASWKEQTENIDYLLDLIVKAIPAPRRLEGTPQMLITSLDFSSYTGRIAVGRVHRGTLKDGQNITICHRDGSKERTKIKELHTSRVVTPPQDRCCGLGRYMCHHRFGAFRDWRYHCRLRQSRGFATHCSGRTNHEYALYY